MQINQLDTFLSLIKLNQKKEIVLKQMKNLELKFQEEKEEYRELISSYQIICYLYQKKLLEITDSQNLLTNLKDLNPSIFTPYTLSGIFLEENVPLKRTLFDYLQTPLLQLYIPQNKAILKSPAFALISSIFNFNMQELTSTDDDISSELVNAYFNHDVFNFFMVGMEKKLKQEEYQDYRKALLTWKYQLILLSQGVEKRMLQTNFSLPDTVNFVDEVSIRTAGIKVEDYLKSLDEICVTLIEGLTDLCLCGKVSIQNLFLYEILIRFLAELLNEKEYCDLLQDDLEEKIQSLKLKGNSYLLETEKRIETILKESKNQQENTKENRKFLKI